MAAHLLFAGKDHYLGLRRRVEQDIFPVDMTLDNDIVSLIIGYDNERTGISFVLSAKAFSLRSAARRHRIHDLHDPDAAGKLCADRAFWRAARIHSVQCGGTFSRP